MRKLIAFFLLTVLGTVVYAQTEGVFFEELTYQEALMKAEKEKNMFLWIVIPLGVALVNIWQNMFLQQKRPGTFFTPDLFP